MLDQRFVFLEIVPLPGRHPGAVALRAQTRVAELQRILLALQQPAHQLLRLQPLVGGIPLPAIDDLDLRRTLAAVDVGDGGAQRLARLVGGEGRARHPQAALVVLQPGLEVGHQEIAQLTAPSEEVGHVAAPRQVGDGLKTGR